RGLRVTLSMPTVVTFHTLTDATLRSRGIALWLLSSAHHAVAANEEVGAMVRRRLSWIARRITEVPIGSNIAIAPPGDPAATRASIGAPPRGPLLVNFGLVYPGKGLETLLEALAIVRETHSEAHLVVAGDTRETERAYRSDLEALAVRLGVARAVTWTGRRNDDEISQILALADVFVAPFDGGASLRRGSLLAAFAHGLAVVSTAPRAASPHLRDGDNVAFVAPRDPMALAARISVLLDSAAQRTHLADGARKLASRLAWPAIAEEMRGVYRRVLA